MTATPRLHVDPAILERFPEYSAVVVYARDLTNGPSDADSAAEYGFLGTRHADRHFQIRPLGAIFRVLRERVVVNDFLTIERPGPRLLPPGLIGKILTALAGRVLATR